jgi:hypothetical protein
MEVPYGRQIFRGVQRWAILGKTPHAHNAFSLTLYRAGGRQSKWTKMLQFGTMTKVIATYITFPPPAPIG